MGKPWPMSSCRTALHSRFVPYMTGNYTFFYWIWRSVGQTVW